jgi:hypothetical protein
VPFSIDEKTDGYQFTLLTNGLELVEIEPGTGMTSDQFAVFGDALAASVENGVSSFALRFRAHRPGQLSDMLAISNSIARSEAYRINPSGAGAQRFDLGLLFDRRLVSKTGPELYQNRPNPFSDQTTISFYLPESGHARLSIFAETGQLLFEQSGIYERGHHSVKLQPTAGAWGPGLLYCQLKTQGICLVQKMVMAK